MVIRILSANLLEQFIAYIGVKYLLYKQLTVPAFTATITTKQIFSEFSVLPNGPFALLLASLFTYPPKSLPCLTSPSISALLIAGLSEVVVDKSYSIVLCLGNNKAATLRNLLLRPLDTPHGFLGMTFASCQSFLRVHVYFMDLVDISFD